MAIDFPASPSVNDIHTSGGKRWTWNGTSWERSGTPGPGDTISATNDNTTSTLYPVLVTGTGSNTAKIATTSSKSVSFNASNGNLTATTFTGTLNTAAQTNITSVGTLGSLNVTGNATIGGVLTYEDVKNVDSVGIITARAGIRVTDGKVGIGTQQPTTLLDIAKNATNQTVATIPTVRLTNLDTTAVATDIVGSYEFFSKDVHSLNKVTGFMRNIPTDAGVNYDLTFGTIKTGDSNAVERLRITSTGEIRIADGGKVTINTDVSGNYAIQEAFRVDDGNSTSDRGLQIFELHNNGVRWHSFNQNLDVTTTGSSYTYTQGNFGGSNMIEMINGNLQIYSDEQVVGGGTSAITPTERIRLRSDGKVLIGSTLGANPYDDRKLTINSTSNTYLSIQSGDSSFSGIVFGHASGQSTDNFLSYVRHNNSDNSFNIHTNSVSIPRVKITSAGRVAVGTDTIPTQGLFFVGVQTSSNNYVSQPTARFAVEGASSPHGDASAVHIGQRAGGSSDPAITFHRRSGDVAWKSWGARIHQGGLDSFRFSFAPAALPGSHSFTDEMVIKRAVGVGIGSIPDEKLHVVISSSTATVAKFERSHNNNVSIEYKNVTSRMYAGLAGDALGWAVDDDANLGNLPMFMVRRTTGYVGVGVIEPLRKLDVLGSGSGGISILARPSTQEINSAGNASSVNNSIIIRMPYGENPASTSNAGARFGIQFTGSNNTTDHTSLNWADDPIKSASIYGVSEDVLGYSRKVGMAFYTSAFDATQTERLRIKNDGNVGIGTNNPNRLLTLFGNDQPVFQITNNTSGTANTRGSIFYQMSGTTTLAIDNQGGGSGGNIHFMSAGVNTFQITSGGLVRTMVRSAEERRMILSGSPSNSAFNIEAHDGESGTSSGDVQGKLGLFYNDGSTLTNTANISFERGSGAADGAMAFVTNQTERLRILSNGNIGVGTDTAPHKFSVKGAISMISGASGTQIVNITQDGSNNGNIIINDSSGTTRIKLDSSDVSYIRGGNLGIGTVAPVKELDVIGDAAIEGDLFLSDVSGQIVKLNGSGGNLDVFSDGTIDFIESDNNKTMVTFDINTIHDDARIYMEGDQNTYFNHPNSDQLGFTIGGQDTIRLKPSQVGIGTVNPTSLLHLMGGDCRLRWSKSDAGADLKHWDLSAQGEVFRIQAKNDADAGGGNIFDFHRTTNQINEFRGLNSGNTWFVIDNLNQKVGIGLTNPQNSLHISGSAPAIRFADTDANGSAFSIIEDNNGLLKLRNDAGNAGTGSGISFEVDAEQKVLITSDGNVGINSSSPSATLEIKDIGSTGPCILIRGATSTEGDITVPDGETFNFGHWNYSSSTFTERVRVSPAGLTTLKNFNGTGLKLEGANSDYQGIQLQVTDASASQTRNIFIDTVNETGAAVANQVGQIQSDGGSHWSWSTQAAGDRTDRRVERVRIKADGKIGISSSSTGTAVVEYESGSTLPPNAVGGITVKVGDEEISNEIQLPRNGHIMVMTGFSDSGGLNYPQPQASGMLYVDVGLSTNIRPMYTQSGVGSDATSNVGTDLVARSTHTNTVSDCTDGRITIMPGTSTGTIRICNRENNSAYVFYLTFL